MEGAVVWTYVLLSCTVTMVTGARSCDMRPVPACTCWNPRRPTISCVDAGLTSLPSLPVDYVDRLDLSYNDIEISIIDKLGHSGLHLSSFTMSHSLSSDPADLPEDYFSHVEKSLRRLDLSNNQLTKIPEAVKL